MAIHDEETVRSMTHCCLQQMLPIYDTRDWAANDQASYPDQLHTLVLSST